jgi:DNA-binding transcriptional LysR family regulator
MHFCMSKNTLDWMLIKSFLAVLDTGSMMAAARKLGAQQPTLSRQIAELELQLGTPLFERTGRGAQPTAAALAIAHAARDMDTSAISLERALAKQKKLNTGVVRITASQVAASYLLPSVLSKLQQAEPGIQIELIASNAISNLLRREADIAVRMIRPLQASVIAKKLGDISIIACAHQRYLKRVGTPQHPRDLLTHKLIGFDRDDSMIRGFAQLGTVMTRENFVFRTDDHLAYGRLVAAGCGIGFIANYNLQYLPEVIPILPMLKIPPLPCWLAVHREIRGSAVVRRVYEFLATTLPEEISL